MKYLASNLTKEVQNLYTEKYKILLKETKEDLNKWKHIPCSWIRRLSIVKMAILPKVIYRLNTIPVKTLVGFFAEINELILNFIWKCKGHRIAKTILKRKNKIGLLNLSDFKTYHNTTVIKIMW